MRMTAIELTITPLLDALADPEVEWTPEQAKEAAKILADCEIELSERPSTNPGVYGNPGASPKQFAVRDAFYSGDYDIVAADGSNQSGKTEAIGGMCFCKWLRDEAKDGDVYWVIAQSHSSMRDIPQKTMWKFLPRAMFDGKVVYHPKYGFGQIPTLLLKLPHGRGTCEISFKTEEMDLKEYESARLNGCWWTECTRQAIFNAIQPRFVAKGGWMLMDYVPTEAWHREQIIDSPDPRTFQIRFCMKDNAHNLSDGSIEKARSRMTPEEVAVRIDGKDGAAQGIVYKEFDRERHVIRPFKIPDEFPRWTYLDYGYRNPTAIGWAAFVPEGFINPNTGKEFEQDTLIIYRELCVREWTIPQIASQFKVLSKGEIFEKPTIVDPTIYNKTIGNRKSIAGEFKDCGMKCCKGPRTNAVGEHAMVANVRKWFEADMINFFDTCTHHIHEHRSWKYKKNRDGETSGNEPFEDKNNHTCDGLRYLIAKHPGFTPLNVRMINASNE